MSRGLSLIVVAMTHVVGDWAKGFVEEE